MEQAQRRAHRISRVLMYDLDGDLRVTRAEIIASASQFNPTFAASQADRLMAQYDLNHDEIIDIHEMASAPEPVRYGPSYDQAGRLEQMLALGGGSRLSATTLAHIAQRTFEKVDTDHNGQISQAEYQAIQPNRTGYGGAFPLPIPPAPNRHYFP
jgi:Ca2+-binding EF-hand superfamily protein